MYRNIVSSIVFLTVLISLNVFAGTVPDFGTWQKGELLLENYSFEDGLDAWELEDGTCCDRGGFYTMEIDKDNPHHGEQSLKVIGHKDTGTAWHAKVKQLNVSMKKNQMYTVIFWARAEEARQVTLSVQMQAEPWTTHQGGNIDLLGPEWAEYFITFTATADVDRFMWVGLSIAQSDVDFWLDSFRFFQGEPKDELGRDEPFPVDPKEKLATQWASVKSDRF